jgi:ketosteroid isomerase-like protein
VSEADEQVARADEGLAAAIVVRALDAFNQRDLVRLLELCDPGIEIVARRSAVEGAFVGHGGARRWALEALEWAPDYRFVIDEVRVVDGIIHVTGRERGVGRAGIAIDDPLDARVVVDGGRIIRVHTQDGT